MRGTERMGKVWRNGEWRKGGLLGDPCVWDGVYWGRVLTESDLSGLVHMPPQPTSMVGIIPVLVD